MDGSLVLGVVKMMLNAYLADNNQAGNAHVPFQAKPQKIFGHRSLRHPEGSLPKTKMSRFSRPFYGWMVCFAVFMKIWYNSQVTTLRPPTWTDWRTRMTSNGLDQFPPRDISRIRRLQKMTLPRWQMQPFLPHIPVLPKTFCRHLLQHHFPHCGPNFNPYFYLRATPHHSCSNRDQYAQCLRVKKPSVCLSLSNQMSISGIQ
jgi:hypothetical protein